ncbi:MAG: ParB N-terminal domain-containing protein, partial [Acidiphilium sp.]|nr:ParB N-terminal domain-containing protein [Acidiphilium sp.]
MPEIDIDLIRVGDRLRSADADQVQALAESIAEVGLLNPISVCPHPVMRANVFVDGFLLVAGLHRLEACKSLGLVSIPAHIVTLTELQRQIAECDENLRGPRLTPSERALFTQRRKEAYEALHPETRNGGDR